MGGLKGDFIGFTYGSYHSSDLGIVRTSDGSRYSDDLSPTNSDQTLARPGSDGTYFFGSYFSQKPIELSFAFDSLTELGLRKLRQVFSNKIPQKLIYDESPYKYYLVKPLTAPNLRYLCFDEGGKRIYKGEGTLSLVAYYPYAKNVYKSLSEYTNENKDEWSAASGMVEFLNGDKTETQYDIFEPISGDAAGTINLYNAGDIEAEFSLMVTRNDTGKIGSEDGIHLFLTIDNESTENQLYLNQITLKGDDDSICINSANNLIEGYSQGKRSGNLYNEYKFGGTFFKIPTDKSILNIVGLGSGNTITITYDYLYY